MKLNILDRNDKLLAGYLINRDMQNWSQLTLIGPAIFPEIDGMVHVGQLIELDDKINETDKGTVFADWNEHRYALPPGTNLFAVPPSESLT